MSVHVSKGMWVPAETRRGCSIIVSLELELKAVVSYLFFFMSTENKIPVL